MRLDKDKDLPMKNKLGARQVQDLIKTKTKPQLNNSTSDQKFLKPPSTIYIEKVEIFKT